MHQKWCKRVGLGLAGAGLVAVMGLFSPAVAPVAAQDATTLLSGFISRVLLAGRFQVGAGDPEGAVTAPVGSVFLRTDGGAGSTLYVKEAGTGNTGWGVPGGAVAFGDLCSATATTEVMFNLAGVCDSDSGMTYAAATDKLTVAGPVKAANLETAYVAKTANYTVTATDGFIACDASSNTVTLTLPTAASIAGREYTMKKIDSTVNACTFDGSGSETIDGAATLATSTQWVSYSIVSNGTNWLVK